MDLLAVFLTGFFSVMASSGFWAWILKRRESKDASRELLIGLAHDRIHTLGMYYINRGYITHDEYENLHDYLYVPYEKMGGNGSAKRVMDEVKRIELRQGSKVHVNEQ